MQENKTEKAEKCLAIFNDEIALLHDIESLQQIVQTAVYEKQWADFDGAQASLRQYCAALETLEVERFALFEESGEAAVEKFYTWAAGLAPALRIRITDTYRQLKQETIKIQIANNSFVAYLNEMQSIVGGFLNAAFPDRRGSIYGRRGKICDADMRSIVLDKQF